MAIAALPAMLVVQRLTERIDRRRPLDDGPAAAVRGIAGAGSPAGRGGTARGTAAVVPAVALSLAVVSFLLQIPGNWLSRQVEARADAYALELTREPGAFVGLQRSLAVQNLSEPDPPELLHDLLATHPTTAERIGFGLEWASAR